MYRTFIIIITAIIALNCFADEEKLPQGVTAAGWNECWLTSLNDASIAFLNDGEYKTYRGLSIRLQGVPNEELARLDELPWLTGVSLSSNGKKGKIDLAVLSRLPKLEKVQVYGTCVTNITELSKYVTLKELDFQGTKLEDISFLKTLVNLETLTLHNIRTIKDYSPLAHLKNLKDLSIGGNDQEPIALAPIAKLKNLESLDISKYKGKSISWIAPCRKLKVLELLCSESLTDISAVTKLPDLEKLLLWGTPVSSIEAVSKCEKMKWLNIEGTKVTSLKPLERLKSLKILDITDTGVKSLTPLLKMKTLKIVSASKSMPKNEIEKFRKALPAASLNIR